MSLLIRLAHTMAALVVGTAAIGCAHPVNDVGYVDEAGVKFDGGGKAATNDAGPVGSGGGSGGLFGVGGTGGVNSGGMGTGGWGNNGSGGFAGSSSCSVEMSDPLCNACMQSQCCNMAELCVGDGDCVGLMQCASMSYACDYVTTASEYVTCAVEECPEYSYGQTAMLGYLSCMDAACTGSCS